MISMLLTLTSVCLQEFSFSTEPLGKFATAGRFKNGRFATSSPGFSPSRFPKRETSKRGPWERGWTFRALGFRHNESLQLAQLAFFCFFGFCGSQSKSYSHVEAEPRSRQKATGEGVRGEGSEKNRLQSTYIHSYIRPYFISNFRVAKNRLVSLL